MITKRQIGLLAIAAGVLTIGGLAGYDVLRHHPIGQRLQLVVLIVAVGAIAIGATLLPLGDRPA